MIFHMYSKAIAALIANAFILICWIFAFDVITSLQTLVYGINTVGTVSAVHTSYNTDKNRNTTIMYQPTITYHCNTSTPITKQIDFSSSTPYYTGEQIELKCNPHAPTEIVILGWPLIVEGSLILLFLFLTIYGIRTLLKAILLSHKRKKLMQTGEQVLATIESIHSTGTIINKTSYWYTLKARDEFRTFTSEEFFLKSPDQITIGDKVPVYVNFTDPEDYWVEVDEII